MILFAITRNICRSIHLRISTIVWILLFAGGADLPANKSYCFRLYLRDKGEKTYRISSPEAFLSPQSVERRRLREVFIDETDFPISRAYTDTLAAIGASVVVQSKWMKTIVVESRDSTMAARLAALPFVDSLKCVWHGVGRQDLPPDSENNDTAVFISTTAQALDDTYGYAENQLAMLNGLPLHAAGYRGKGVRIAVIDAGFRNVDRIKAFSPMHLLGSYNVTCPDRSVFREDDHGTKVLSCIAANQPGMMMGAAPEASFLLIKSEDTRSESPLEEDFWAAAVEYADSIGVDIISSSLGYFRFDGTACCCCYYTRSDLNGQTAFISRVAGIAAKKGMLVVSSAGNEGGNEWEKITFPADAPDVLTVGSITAGKQKSSFSSVGMTADYRIKPDVVALGTGVYVIGSTGQVQCLDGTSFSAPTVAGMIACLWQAFPLLKNTGLIELLKASSSQYQQPDIRLGYGIPDLFKAYNQAKSQR
jgi:subtilisin family serine protease